MKKRLTFLAFLGIMLCTGFNCDKKTSDPAQPAIDSSYVNLAHLEHLYRPITFPGGGTGGAIYIYANAPNYDVVEAGGEGYTCVDDVSRAALVYARSTKLASDTAIQSRLYSLISFMLEMQSPNGYFYNFVYSDGLINKFGATSVNNANWWSWRALQALTEALPAVQARNTALAARMQTSIANLVAKIKTDLVNIPTTTHITEGVTVPEWLPAGSGTDQAALLVMGLISYSASNNDPAITAYIRKLSDGIALMQAGDATRFPFGCLLSWENTWHAYGCDQALALLKAGAFLNDQAFTDKGLNEVKSFYPWLIQNGYLSSFTIRTTGGSSTALSQNSYEQIAYGFRPMVFAAVEAYKITGQASYADIAGHLAAWFLGANETNSNMYDKTTGRCFDAISAAGSINRNSGAESTIEALLTFQLVEANAAVKAALDVYKR